MPDPVGYDRMATYTVEEVIALHDDVARHGQTWDLGVRDRGTLDSLVQRIHSMARRQLPPEEIAGAAAHFTVREHPFWDANHRTGYGLLLYVLAGFGRKIDAPQDEIETTMRAIDAKGLRERALVEWIQSKTVSAG